MLAESWPQTGLPAASASLGRIAEIRVMQILKGFGYEPHHRGGGFPGPDIAIGDVGIEVKGIFKPQRDRFHFTVADHGAQIMVVVLWPAEACFVMFNHEIPRPKSLYPELRADEAPWIGFREAWHKIGQACNAS